MTAYPPIDSSYLQAVLVDLLETPSPTGFTDRAIQHVARTLSAFSDLALEETPKGALRARWAGGTEGPARAITAHVDTLGAMVKEIRSNGRLKLTRIGGFAWNTVEGEGCTVFPYQGNPIRGSLLLQKASGHVHGPEVGKIMRDADTLEVRLDAHTTSKEETRDLGISVGDFVAFDPRVEVHDGYIRSRYLDDKAGVAALIAAVQALSRAGRAPARTTFLHFSNYEEVGHGASAGIPPEVTELIAVDMAVVGDGQASDEHHATLCVKDRGGPYHYGLSRHLRSLAEEHDIPYRVDIYPHYSSDGEAYWRAGGDVAVALMGPGVDASHNYERTHMDALEATARWIVAYLLSER